MLHGTPVINLTSHEAARLNVSQNTLFKKILGLPRSAANESVFLLTGLIPLLTQLEQNCLLLIGQLTSLPHHRFEKRTLLHASITPVPLSKAWDKLLSKYNLPDIISLIDRPPSYSSWKSLIKKTIHQATINNVNESISTKKTLSFWKDLTCLPSPSLIFPVGLPPHLRKAQLARTQLLTQTYPVQSRLAKIGRATSTLCPLCKLEDEDAVHFISSCPYLQPQRSSFISRAILKFPELDIKTEPLAFTKLILLPNPNLPRCDSDTLTSLSLNFILQIHTLRASITQDCTASTTD